jgi:hypothetical protein
MLTLLLLCDCMAEVMRNWLIQLHPAVIAKVTETKV